MILVAPLLVALAAAGASYLVLSGSRDRGLVRSSLKQIGQYQGASQAGPARDSELAAPLAQRVVVPALSAAVRLVRRLTPIDYMAKTRRQLVLAGRPTAEQLDRFLVLRVIVLLLTPASFLVAFPLMHLQGMAGWSVVVLLSAISILGPSAGLNRKIAERRMEIERTLPEVLDLLTISVEAGLGFEQALDRAVDAVPGALTEELRRMLGEMRAGARRADALRSFDDRTGVPDVHAFALAILQADAFGVSTTRVLRSQADEMRVKRRQLAQERAQKAPVKMLIPMVFCVFPSLFVVILGPAAINIMHNLR